MHRRSLLVSFPVVVAVLLAIGVTPARADLSKKVITAFKGKILVTTGALEMGANDKDTIAAFKKKGLTQIEGAENGNDVQEWTFVYTGFLKSAGVTSLKLEFYAGDQYAADQTLVEVDPKLTVVQGDITINEDDGLNKGKTYTLKLVGKVKGKEVVLATLPKLLMK